jgi:6-phosphofructokinase 2
LTSEGAQIEFATELIEAGSVDVVVISLGAGGALWVTEGAHKHVRSPTVPIESRIGAGDSMVAGIALSLERGDEIGRAVEFGVAAGAAAVMTEGTQLCGREETEELFARIHSE